ncbi:protein-export chaperone SecB [Polynucleobacter sp. 30F-ANTBAC]|jgi:preprotein translocase subunit SecB|uniref:protein-export chaperone SecB n=1 Tax=Polynucleobacter sp. 30F-ANTBAC TaxID=2689095 RepID=UPI001C0DF5AE|nr:protein-export chaperone SecB [Polynucleobacter sp. 30F-ANTBAC]MBU3600162.1 protein-export chaperone SecB [Polynucleobacter sp. 30F-ANTBAC]
MTEAAANSAQDSAPSFQIQRVYLKDMSLEQPNAPEILLVQAEPKLEVQVDIQANQLDENNFHVTLVGTVTTRIEEKVLFLVEAHQSGIFEMRHMPAEQLDPMLGIACPTILFPYLRSNIADMISRAGFQPIHLAEINFHSLYEQRLAQAAGTPASNDSGIILPN